MNKLIVELDDSDLFIKFGIYCVKNGLTKKAAVTKMLQTLLEKES